MTNPYRDLPGTAYWKPSVAEAQRIGPELVGEPKFTFDRTTPIMTAGSCFAANVTRFLVQRGYNHVMTERLHPFFRGRAPDWETRAGMGEYAAGYGNIYTPRQMIQLIDRAWGRFRPVEDRWERQGFGIVDAFRPRIGFPAEGHAEFEALRDQHFRAVRAALASAGILVFTLGLTEAWVSAADGAVFPVCPGVVAGTFDPDRHRFVNFTVSEIVSDLALLLRRLAAINPELRVILTVSPVPLVATASGQHVLRATTYSKSVLRVAAEQIAQRSARVEYFPSYEIVTGPQAPWEAFEPDRRSVTREIVAQVMDVFFAAYARDAATDDNAPARPGAPAAAGAPRGLGEILAAAECEEELLASHLTMPGPA